MSLTLCTFLILSSFCLTPDENAGKEVVPKEIKAMRELVKGKNTIVEVSFKTNNKMFTKVLANCEIKDAKLTGQIVKVFVTGSGTDYVTGFGRLAYMLDTVHSVKVIKKSKTKE